MALRVFSKWAIAATASVGIALIACATPQRPPQSFDEEPIGTGGASSLGAPLHEISKPRATPAGEATSGSGEGTLVTIDAGKADGGEASCKPNGPPRVANVPELPKRPGSSCKSDSECALIEAECCTCGGSQASQFRSYNRARIPNFAQLKCDKPCPSRCTPQAPPGNLTSVCHRGVCRVAEVTLPLGCK